MRLYRFVAALFVMSAALAAPAAVRAQQPWTQVGGLTCKVSANVGFIIGGHQPMACTFAPADGSAPQFYDGAINTIGIDVGVTEGSVLGWGVFAPTKGIAPGALAGEYVGASGDLGFGVGGGANVLVGGSARTFALQPLSLQGSIALNVVLGLSSLKLRVKQ
jgi:Protein of unknown function (DUF992)